MTSILFKYKNRFKIVQYVKYIKQNKLNNLVFYKIYVYVKENCDIIGSYHYPIMP